MSEIALGIWRNAPVWIWPLFVVLVAVGIMAMRTRDASLVPYLFFPLFGLSAVGAIGGLVHVPLNWIVFSIAYAAGLVPAFRWQDGLILRKERRRMRLRGERVTLAILMVVFFSNFVNGVIEEVAPLLRDSPVFTVIFAALVGACAGSFLGRGLRVVTLGARKAPAT